MTLSTKRDMRLMLLIEHRADGWWISSSIIGVDEMGPYPRRVDAVEARHGVLAWCRRNRRLVFPLGGVK